MFNRVSRVRRAEFMLGALVSPGNKVQKHTLILVGERSTSISDVYALFENARVQIDGIRSLSPFLSGDRRVELSIRVSSDANALTIVADLRSLAGLHEVGFDLTRDGFTE